MVHLLDFPEEVLCDILTRLTPRDLVSVNSTARGFHKLSHAAIWSSVRCRLGSVSSRWGLERTRGIAAMGQAGRLRCLQRLYVSITFKKEPKRNKKKKGPGTFRFPKAEEAILQEIFEVITSLFTHTPAVQTVTFNCGYGLFYARSPLRKTMHPAWDALFSLPRLERLYLSEGPVRPFQLDPSRFPLASLRSLTIADVRLLRYVRHMPNLSALTIRATHGLPLYPHFQLWTDTLWGRLESLGFGEDVEQVVPSDWDSLLKNFAAFKTGPGTSQPRVPALRRLRFGPKFFNWAQDDATQRFETTMRTFAGSGVEELSLAMPAKASAWAQILEIVHSHYPALKTLWLAEVNRFRSEMPGDLVSIRLSQFGTCLCLQADFCSCYIFPGGPHRCVTAAR